jgi:hypothetical protein
MAIGRALGKKFGLDLLVSGAEPIEFEHNVGWNCD